MNEKDLLQQCVKTDSSVVCSGDYVQRTTFAIHIHTLNVSFCRHLNITTSNLHTYIHTGYIHIKLSLHNANYYDLVQVRFVIEYDDEALLLVVVHVSHVEIQLLLVVVVSSSTRICDEGVVVVLLLLYAFM